ncbi:MAG: dTDP-4-dehydrorhamnose 3,5-epimerase [Pirellulales bacterium]
MSGLYLIDIEPHVDARGFFARSFCRREFIEHELHGDFVQCNLSHNRLLGTLRGMHYRRPPHDEVKLVRCTAGAVYDVVVDLRSQSSTFMQYYGIELTAESRQMLYIPVGFAHGFLTLRDDTEVFYQMGDYYQPDAEEGFCWNDFAFQIDWPTTPIVMSQRDASYEDFDPVRLQEMFTYD